LPSLRPSSAGLRAVEGHDGDPRAGERLALQAAEERPLPEVKTLGISAPTVLIGSIPGSPMNPVEIFFQLGPIPTERGKDPSEVPFRQIGADPVGAEAAGSICEPAGGAPRAARG